MKIADTLYAKFPEILFSRTRETGELILASTNPAEKLDPRAWLWKELDAYKKAKIFILDESLATPGQFLVSHPISEVLSPPFETCWFEKADGTDFGGYRSSVGGDAYIFGFLLREMRPGLFSVAVVLSEEDYPMVRFVQCGDVEDFFKTMNPDKFTAKWITRQTYVSKLVGRVIDQIHASKLGEEKCYKTIKIKTQNGSEYHKVNTVIRLRPKNGEAKVGPLFSREIDWSHRWWVRGHWRSLGDQEQIGKDRSGEYTMKGFTWVIEHTKGPDTKPIVDKTYLI